jgi:hypothetical protein
VIVHQNLEAIYWRLSSKREGLNQIIKFNNHEYVLQTSPPWIKYESMIYWYQHLSDDPDFDIHEYIIEHGTKLFDSNSNDNFIFLSKALLDILNHPTNEERLHDFNLYDHSKVEYVSETLNKITSKPVCNFYQHLLTTGKSFKFPFTNNFYCSNYSINRLSYIAGKHVYNIILESNINNFNPNDIFKPGKNQKKFMSFFYQSIMAYLSSKIINPYLKCDMYQDLSRKLNDTKTSEVLKKKIKLTLNILDGQSKLQILLKGQTTRTIYSSSFLAGHILADSIFDKFYKTGDSMFDYIISLITSGDLSKIRFLELKTLVFPNNEYRLQKKRFF